MYLFNQSVAPNQLLCILMSLSEEGLFVCWITNEESALQVQHILYFSTCHLHSWAIQMVWFTTLD